MRQIFFSSFGIVGLCIAVSLGLYIEIFCYQIPCILCFLQRACMLMTALGLYWNIMYGVQVRHYAFSLMASFIGLSCALRHMGLNVCLPIKETTFFFCFYRIYTWSFLVFALSIASLSLLLFFYKPDAEKAPLWMRYLFGGILFVFLLFCAVSSLYHKRFAF